jgi:hypothetical protein
MAEVPNSPEAETLAKPPEIIANPALPNTRLIVSIPIKDEFKNGHVIRHLSAFFRQHIPNGVAVESNYILNGGTTPDNLTTLGFLKKVIAIQALGRLQKQGNGLIDQKVSDLVHSETNPLHKKVLKDAAEKADHVSISVINDIEDARFEMGNYLFGTMGSLRTVGMDYARKRLIDENAVFHLYDIDTVPEDNNYVRDLLAIYDAHPEINYVFANLTHLPAGQHKDLVADSPSNTIRGHYNWWVGQGSPQISFRLKTVDRIKAIMPYGWHGDEDRDTSYRLVGMFADDQKDVLKLGTVTAFPRSLASDRTGGTVDGAGRLERVYKDEPKDVLGYEYLHYTLKDRQEVLDKIAQLPPELSEKAQSDLEKLRKIYAGKQKALTRFNRFVVKTFLGSLDDDTIKITGDGVVLEEDKLLSKQFGEALLLYVRANKDLLISLTRDDLDLMKYYTDENGTFPEHITELSPFQKAVREYIGIYDPGVFSIQGNTTIDHRGTNITDKRTLYEPFLTEMLAVSSINSKYFKDEAFLEGRKDDWEALDFVNESYDTRADWIQTQLLKIPDLDAQQPTHEDQLAGQDILWSTLKQKVSRLGSIFDGRLKK